MADEGALERMKLPVPGDAFNSRDSNAFAGCSQQKTAVFGFSIDEDGACPADTQVAPLFSSCQSQFIPQDIQEGFAISDGYRMLLSVDFQSDDTMVFSLLAHDRSRARAQAAYKDLRVKTGIKSFLYLAEPRRSEIGFPASQAREAASSNKLSEGFSPHNKSEAFTAKTGVGATAPRTIRAFTILSSSREIWEATPTTARALASRRASF
jgi:hypothetical protein